MGPNAPLANLERLGLKLPLAPTPVANYAPYVLSSQILTISGQLPFDVDGAIPPRWIGKLGLEVDIQDAIEAARQCALNILAQAQTALGDLDKIHRVVRLGGFINAYEKFDALPLAMNGASDLMVAVFGERGRHARSTVGVAQLPLCAVIEIEAAFEVRAA